MKAEQRIRHAYMIQPVYPQQVQVAHQPQEVQNQSYYPAAPDKGGEAINSARSDDSINRSYSNLLE